MRRYLAHPRDLFWTLRYGDRSSINWPRYLRALPVALLIAYEAYFAYDAWGMVHTRYASTAWHVVTTIYIVWAVYIAPLWLIAASRP